MPKDNGIVNTKVRLEWLKPHPENYRFHPEEQIEDIRASFREHGQVASIVIQRTAKPQEFLIVAGHGRVTAALAEGYTELRADVIPEDWLPEQVEDYMTRDNLTQLKAVDNPVKIMELVRKQQNAGRGSAGLDSATISALVQRAREGASISQEKALKAPSVPGAGTESQEDGDEYTERSPEDSVDELFPFEYEPAKRVIAGDIWKLGEHRLFCGYYTDGEKVREFMHGKKPGLIWANPPRSVRLLAPQTPKSRRYLPIMPPEEEEDWTLAFKHYYTEYPDSWHVWFGANCYSYALPPSIHWLVWNTGSGHELAWTNRADSGPEYYNYPAKDSRNLFPPVFLEDAWDSFTEPGELILALESGAAPLIAGERSSRRVYLIESEPWKADSLLNKYELLAGEEALLIGNLYGERDSTL